MRVAFLLDNLQMLALLLKAEYFFDP